MIRVVKKWSLEGIWHTLRFKTVRKQITRKYFRNGDFYEIQWACDWEHSFETRRWYSMIIGNKK